MFSINFEALSENSVVWIRIYLGLDQNQLPQSGLSWFFIISLSHLCCKYSTLGASIGVG